MAKTIHIDLSEDGLPGQWMDIANLGAFSPSDFEELAAGQEDGQTAHAFVAAVVVAWNIQRRDGESLPPPTSPDLDIKLVPTAVTARLGQEVQRQIEEIRNPKVRS